MTNLRILTLKTFRQRSIQTLHYLGHVKDEARLMTIAFRLFLMQLRRYPMVILGLIFVMLGQLKRFRSPLFLRAIFRGAGVRDITIDQGQKQTTVGLLEERMFGNIILMMHSLAMYHDNFCYPPV
jgi:hypothetical protein